MPLSRHSHFTAPGDLDLRGLGLVLDAGHAALTGTLAEWLSEPQATCATCTCTTTAAAATATATGRSAAAWSTPGRCSAAARTAGATIALELTNEADVAGQPRVPARQRPPVAARPLD